MRIYVYFSKINHGCQLDILFKLNIVVHPRHIDIIDIRNRIENCATYIYTIQMKLIPIRFCKVTDYYKQLILLLAV